MSSAGTAPRTPSAVAVWFGVFTGAVAWTLHLGISYLLVPLACLTNSPWVFHVTTVVTGGATLVAGIFAFRAWRMSQVGLEADAHDRSGMDELTRRRGFMGLIGTFLSAIFFVLILAEAVGTVVLSPCQGRDYGPSSFVPPSVGQFEDSRGT